MEWLDLKKLVEKEKIEMCEAEKKWEVEGIKKESNKEWEKRAWNVSNNDGQGILELKLLMKA